AACIGNANVRKALSRGEHAMSQGKRVRRKPGSIGGTVVPPSAPSDVVPAAPMTLPSLPKRRPGEHHPAEVGSAGVRSAEVRSAENSPLPRRRPGEHGPGPRASGRDQAGPQAQRSQVRRSRPEPSGLPDNVRSLFKPGLIAPAPTRSPAGG